MEVNLGPLRMLLSDSEESFRLGCPGSLRGVCGRAIVHIRDRRVQDRIHNTQGQLPPFLASRCKEKNVATHHKYEFKIVDEGPANGVAILFVSFLILTAFDECLADETVHR